MLKNCWPSLGSWYRYEACESRRWVLVYLPTIFVLSVFVAIIWLGLGMTNGTFGKKDLEVLGPWFFALFVLETLLFAHVVFLRRKSRRLSQMLVSPAPIIPQSASYNHDIALESIVKRPEGGDQVLPHVASPKLVYQYPYGPHAHTKHAGLPSAVLRGENTYTEDIEVRASSEPRNPRQPPVAHASWLSTIDESRMVATSAANPAQSPKTYGKPKKHVSWDVSMDTSHGTGAFSTAVVAPVQPGYGHFQRVEAPVPINSPQPQTNKDQIPALRMNIPDMGTVAERDLASPALTRQENQDMTEPRSMLPNPPGTVKPIPGLGGIAPSATSRQHQRNRELLSGPARPARR